MATTDFIFGIIHDIGVFALVAMLYRSLLERFTVGALKSALVGLLFGLAAAFAIVSASRIMSGVVIDPRNVMLGLAAPFGGPLAAIVAALVAAAARCFVGGLGLSAGLVNIALAAAIGITFRLLMTGTDRPVGVGRLVVLGVTINASLVSVLMLPAEVLHRLLSGPLPILAAANVVGVIVLGRFLCRERKAVLTKERLAREAMTDTLTQLPNRRMLELLTDRMFEEAARRDHPVSMLVIDIDRFKQFNDRFGHDIGDSVLKRVADAIRANVRVQDALARFGGEEIVVAMPNTDGNVAMIVAERIRAVIDREIFHLDRETANVTVSIGVATGSSREVAFEGLFKLADEALFAAKRLGRNRVQAAGSLMAISLGTHEPTFAAA